MQYKILILIFFCVSCSPHYTKFDNRNSYNSTGFALIYNEQDYKKKIIKNKFNNDLLQISHKDLRTGTLIKLINPKTNESLILKNFKKTKFPDFYKILITRPVADKLNIDNQLPLVKILEIKKNKLFIAEKAKIYQEEKKISSTAPVTSVQISNISKKIPKKIQINKTDIYILIASFYTDEAANLLKQRIITDKLNYNIDKLIIKKRSSKEFEVLSGPYKSIILLKNDYIDLKNLGFEELDITINE
jgi:uncharacterized membrane-anchored protein